MAVVQRIYGQALLSAAREAGRLDTVRDELRALVEAVRGSHALAVLLRNPRLGASEKRAVLDSLMEGADQRLRNFLRLLLEKSRIGQLEEIQLELERLIAEEERVLTLELTTAVELSDDEVERIVSGIEQACGRRVEATRRVEPAIIGGLVLRAGSQRLDGSVRGRLDQLREQLTGRS